MSKIYEYHEQNIQYLRHYSLDIDPLSKDIGFFMTVTGDNSVIGLIHTLFDEILSLESKVEELNTKVLRYEGRLNDPPTASDRKADEKAS